MSTDDQGLVSTADDYSVSTLYNPSAVLPTLSPYSEATGNILRVRALAILDRACRLKNLDPEPGWQEPLRDTLSSQPSGSASGSNSSHMTKEPADGMDIFSDPVFASLFGVSPGATPPTDDSFPSGPNDVGKHKGWTRTARIRTPKAYEEVIAALKRIEDDLPPERRTNWEVWDGVVQDWGFGNNPDAAKNNINLVSCLRHILWHTRRSEADASISSSALHGCSPSMSTLSVRQMTKLLQSLDGWFTPSDQSCGTIGNRISTCSWQ